MSDLIRKIGELQIAAVVDYNEKAAALAAADRNYTSAYTVADQKQFQARKAAADARDAAIAAVVASYEQAIAAADAEFDTAVDALDAAYEPFVVAEQAAKISFDKARAAWAAVVDDVAVGGLEDEGDDYGEEADEDEEEASVSGEAEVQEEGVVTDVQTDLFGQEVTGETGSEALDQVPADASGDAGPEGPAAEANVEAGVTDGLDTTIPAPETTGGGEAVQVLTDAGPTNEAQGATPQEEVTFNPGEGAGISPPSVEVTQNDPTQPNFPEVTITGTLTVGDTVVEPAPTSEVGGIEPPVGEPSVGEGSGEPVAAPVIDPAPAVIDFTPPVVPEPAVTVDATPPAPPVEAEPEAPETFPVEFADVPFADPVDLPVDAPMEVIGPDGDFPKQQ